MGIRFFSLVAYFLRLLALFGLYGLNAILPANAACFSTQVAAIDSMSKGSSLPSVPVGVGYRVASIQSDPLLGQQWARVVRCDHPEWPAVALPTWQAGLFGSVSEAGRIYPNAVSAAPMVRLGDVLRLWKREDLLRIDVAGIAEENGDLGKTIRVRLARKDTNDPSPEEHRLGIVRGPSSAEMRP